MGIILARWMKPEGFGAYAFVIAAVGLLVLPAKLGLPELLTRDIAAERGRRGGLDIRRLFFKAIALTGVASLAIVLTGELLLPLLPETPAVALLKIGLWLILP